MGDSLLYKLRSGKPPKIFFFLKGYLLMCMPTCFFRLCRKRYLAQVETRSDKDYIYERVNYYNKMRHPVALPDKTFHEHKFGYYIFLDKIRKFRPSTFHKVYYFDLQDVLRWFSQKLRIGYIPGDVYFTPEFPAIVKSRLLKNDNEYSVLLKLDKLRHFMFVNDPVPFSGKSNQAYTSALKDIHSFAPSCSRGDRTRFFLKVQDGCDYYCSYCTIPFARGRSRNGSIASLVEQARQAAAEGGREIVLTGVNIGDFGKTTGETFFDLVKALDEVEGIERYRISSIEPNLLTEEIIEFVSRSKRFMPHFHIPLQSGSDEVLKLMRRRYDTALFASKVKKIKEAMPDSFIGVDVIVGTRGETEEYFEQAYEFIKGLDVTQLHVFSYSERPGTQALKIDHVVSPAEKHVRSQRLLELSEEKTRAFYARHIGQAMPVLLERSKPGTPMHGFTPNYIRVEVPHDDALDNQVVTVRLGDFNEDGTALSGIYNS